MNGWMDEWAAIIRIHDHECALDVDVDRERTNAPVVDRGSRAQDE